MNCDWPYAAKTNATFNAQTYYTYAVSIKSTREGQEMMALKLEDMACAREECLDAKNVTFIRYFFIFLINY